jgi:hypothetical protein
MDILFFQASLRKMFLETFPEGEFNSEIFLDQEKTLAIHVRANADPSDAWMFPPKEPDCNFNLEVIISGFSNEGISKKKIVVNRWGLRRSKYVKGVKLKTRILPSGPEKSLENFSHLLEEARSVIAKWESEGAKMAERGPRLFQR